MNGTSGSSFLCGNPFMPIPLVFQRSCEDPLPGRVRGFLPPEEQSLQAIKRMQSAGVAESARLWFADWEPLT